MRQLEDWEPQQIRTRTGKSLDVKTQLTEAERQYRSTRKVFNLLSPKKTRVVTPHRPNQRARATKYTKEQAEWLSTAAIDQIALHYGVNTAQAQSIRYYACRLYGLKSAK